jgi:hypothetical protein
MFAKDGLKKEPQPHIFIYNIDKIGFFQSIMKGKSINPRKHSVYEFTINMLNGPFLTFIVQ